MVVFVAFSFVLAACSNNERPDDVTDITENTVATENTEPQTDPATEEVTTSSSYLFSEDDAVAIVRKYLEERGDDLTDNHIDYDGMRSFDDKEYHCVHEYFISPCEYEGTRMSYTLGWYYVDPLDGKIYIEKYSDKSRSFVPIESSSEPEITN